MLAAAGVVWERTHAVLTRPRSDVRVRVTTRRTGIKFASDGEGDWSAEVKNWGNVVAHDVALVGIGCTVRRGHEGPPVPSLGAGVSVPFSLDVDESAMELAWMLVTWVAPTSRRASVAWFPLAPQSELAKVQARQLDRSPIQRAAARVAIGTLSTPVSVAYGHSPPTPPQSAGQRRQQTSLRKPTRWRRLLAKLFRIEPEPVAAAAMAPLLP